MDFPDSSVVENPPANAGDRGSIPDPRGPHMPCSNEAREPQLLRLGATIAESMGCNSGSPCTRSLCSAAGEATARRSLHAATREEPSFTATKEKPAQQ